MESFARVPIWCAANVYGPNADWAHAWIYLLIEWYDGNNPSTAEIRRHTGFGGPRADRLVREVSAWAVENGAAIPESRRAAVGVRA